MNLPQSAWEFLFTSSCMVSETIELHKFVLLQKVRGCVHEVIQRVNTNTKIAIQPGGVCFSDIAGIGICLFSGAAKPTPRSQQQNKNADLNDNANHGSPPASTPYNRASHPQRSEFSGERT